MYFNYIIIIYTTKLLNNAACLESSESTAPFNIFV
jgi:hypothetical protein